MKLPESEEKLMQILWQNGPCFMKDLLAAYPEPKPAKTTIATLLKRLKERGAIDYLVYGNSREYHAILSKQTYFGGHLQQLIDNFFSSSPLKFASFFTEETDLSEEQLRKLRELIDKKIKK